MGDDIKVSICVIAYNQEQYIGECLQSLVNQKTNFKFEVIVGEDCSSDRTKEIVEEFQRRYPDIIKILPHENNVGPVRNIIAVYRQAKGKYISHMDGDDFALPGKLQLQADVLDENPDCVICSHDMRLIAFNGVGLDTTFKVHGKVKNTIFDLYRDLPFFAHSSKMFVNDMADSFWDELDPQAIDIELHAQQAKKGMIYHLNQVLGGYRVGVGVSLQKKVVNPLIVRGCERVFTDALSVYKSEYSYILKCYARSYLNYSYQSALYGDAKGYSIYLIKSLRKKVFSVRQLLMSLLMLCPHVAIFLARKRSRLSNRIVNPVSH